MQRVSSQIVKQPKLCLILEDHHNARAWMKEAVSEAYPGVKVLEAASIKQAQPYLELKLDLALLDIGLPDGSGIDFIAPLVEINCEVLIATAFGDDEHLFNALKQGATGYVLKGEPQSELIAMLTGILEGRPPLSPSIARRVLQHFTSENADSASQEPVHLTTRERDVLTLLAKGYTVKDVAGLLEISYYTAAGYAKSVYRKLNVSSRAEATLEATKRGYVAPN